MGDAEWLANVLRNAGCAVVEVPGWKDRGHSVMQGPFHPRYVMWHHDATPAGPTPGAVDMMVAGRAGLAGPLCNLWVDTVGRCYIIAAGVAYHAGAGGPYANVPADRMNAASIGIETDHTVNEPWPAVQLAGLRRATAAILRYLGQPPNPGLLFHRTWAPTRKIDPDGLVLVVERRAVADLIATMPTGSEDDVTPDDIKAVVAALRETPIHTSGGDVTLIQWLANTGTGVASIGPRLDAIDARLAALEAKP